MISLTQAMLERHSVRSYQNKKLDDETKKILNDKIKELNEKSGLHIQLVTDETKAFDGFMAHYGNFSGVSNYFALVGKKGADLEEKCGYYGQQLVLLAQQLGLNTCWVAMSYAKVKNAYEVKKGEKLCVVIALGYGTTQGKPHKSKDAKEVSNVSPNSPQWFVQGVEAALLAPTAINQQKFFFVGLGEKVTAKPGIGFYTKLDLGIAKLHFEIASGHKVE